jgi:hypothetical protein
MKAVFEMLSEKFVQLSNSVTHIQSCNRKGKHAAEG